MNQHDLDKRFDYHRPDTDGKVLRHEEARKAMKRAAERVDELVPDECREKSLAITHLEEAMFWTNAAIARKD